MNWFARTFILSHANHKAIIPMEGIRGFAVFLVFLVHYTTLAEPWLNRATATYTVFEHIRSIGNMGVDLFFVLSGYLIYGMLIKKQQPFFNYLLRRIQRIYPTFTAVFIIYLGLSAVFPGESKIPGGYHGLVFVIQNYLLMPGLFSVTPIITVAWSLSYEFFYYLLIPLVVACLRMRVWQPRHRIVFFLFATLAGFGYFSIHNAHIRLLMFVAGMLLFETTDNRLVGKMPNIGLISLMLAMVAVILSHQFNVDGWWKYALLYGLFYVFCLDCFVSDGLSSRVFSLAPLRWLGNMSYSYYLIHGLSLKFIFLILGKIYPPQHADIGLFWGLLPLIFSFTLVPATLLFIAVEKPFSLSRKPALNLQFWGKKISAPEK